MPLFSGRGRSEKFYDKWINQFSDQFRNRTGGFCIRGRGKFAQPEFVANIAREGAHRRIEFKTHAVGDPIHALKISDDPRCVDHRRIAHGGYDRFACLGYRRLRPLYHGIGKGRQECGVLNPAFIRNAGIGNDADVDSTRLDLTAHTEQ